MLAEQDAWETFKTLPPDEKREVVDFIARLKARQAGKESLSQTTDASPSLLEKTVSKEQVGVKSVSPLGAMKGLVIHMSDDFDEPLEDFAEYMV
jgi:hypothetical protein